jgi:hypothetical protein
MFEINLFDQIWEKVKNYLYILSKIFHKQGC